MVKDDIFPPSCIHSTDIWSTKCPLCARPFLGEHMSVHIRPNGMGGHALATWAVRAKVFQVEGTADTEDGGPLKRFK